MIPVAFDMRDPVRSGIARVARCMARAFAMADGAGEFDVSFAGPARSLFELGAARWGSRPSRLVPWESGRLSLTASLAWPRVTRAVGPAVWYFPHWDVPWLARPMRSVVLVSDVIPLVVPGATSPARKVVAQRWIRRSALTASRIAVSTRFTGEELTDLWPDLAPKISVVPLGVDDRFFSTPAALPADLERIAGAAPFMLSVGNRKPHKNLLMGPEVLARVPDVNWVVVGESFPGWEEVMRRASTLGVTHRIHVLDPRPDAEVHSLYATAACLFFPSRNEGFGLPILEALASGTRVVAGTAGASAEVLGGQGALCDLDDADRFAEAVAHAVSAGPPGPGGREHAARYTWAASAASLATLIRQIVHDDPGAPDAGS